MESKLTILPGGAKCWYNENGLLHREDGPAVIWVDGDKEWFINGKRHREDGPAYETVFGTKSWWINGKMHRLNRPAFIVSNGFTQWCINLSISYNPIMDNA